MLKTAALALAAAAAASVALAQTPPTPSVVRGKVAALSGNTLTVKTDRGPTQAITLTPTWVVSVTKPVPIDAIQPGSFIGTSNMPTKDGGGRSLEVHVFPPGVKMGEGHYGWDLKKGSMMTNGTVGTVVAGKKGSRELDVNYTYGKRHITVPANVPVVQITPGKREQIKPGVPVFLVVQKRPDGQVMAGGVSIGENGKKPPM
ncbi:hypothetical protein [Phenylobacterium sp.]|jgi:hypothetical protein|uniref:hypothetical protein n=1 Tax=Phenylobacterium sp. TaxID=1871053 RepID=UPI002F92D978